MEAGVNMASGSSEPIYQLSPDVAIRRESFGCMVFNRQLRLPAQFNSDAWIVLGRLRRPRALSEIVRDLVNEGISVDDDRLRRFLDARVADGLVSTQEQAQSARVIDRPAGLVSTQALSAPWASTIYVTERCPKRCLHCIVSSSPKASTDGELTVEQWQVALQRLYDWGVIALIFTGGEPLIRPGIFDILEMASEMGFSLSLLTDFDGMTERHVERLRQIENLAYIQTSVDGASAATHDLLRGAGSFQRTLRRLALFREATLDYTISTVVNRSNMRDLDALVNLYFEYNAQSLYLNPLSPYGRARSEATELTLSDAQLRELAVFYYWAVAVRGVDSGNAYWQNLTFDEAMSPDFHPFADVPELISTGAYVFSIGPRGECHLDSKAKAENFLPFGNILADDLDLDEVWRHPALAMLRQKSGGLEGRKMLDFSLARQTVELLPRSERMVTTNEP